jgi:gluconokinase
MTLSSIMKANNTMHIHHPQSWIVMGVSGCGKSEIGRDLAARLQIDYIEGDSFHSKGNIAKMSSGRPLTDDDRYDWLLVLQEKLRLAAVDKRAVVLSCSALKRRYRDLLRVGDPNLIFVHLDGSRELIASRMKARSGHFMPLALLDSQFADLEQLQPDERFIKIDIHASPDEIVDQVVTFRNGLTSQEA